MKLLRSAGGYQHKNRKLNRIHFVSEQIGPIKSDFNRTKFLGF